jgi:GxxExxY protein
LWTYEETRKPGGVTLLAHEELTGKIIGAAIEVHRRLGPGFVESIYENALAIELRERGLHFERQTEISVS